MFFSFFYGIIYICEGIVRFEIIYRKRDYTGWKFDWSIPMKSGYDIYALKIKDDKQIQGMVAIAVENNNRAVYVNLAETAPHNYGRNGKYDGVGGHLFAFACKIAYEQGYDYIFRRENRVNRIL